LEIKYCGNCNPDAHPREVRTAAEALFKHGDSAALVLINGCTRVCLSKKGQKEQHAGRIIEVRGRDILRKESEAGRDVMSSSGRKE
jgi:hypothetical protein